MSSPTAGPAGIPTVPGKLPGIGHVPRLLRNPLAFMRSLRDTGDLAWVHLGPQRVLSVNSPELVHRMLVTDGRKYDQGKYFDKIRQEFGNGLPVSNGAFHTRQRRLIQPAFHRERIEGYFRVMADSAAAMTSRWQPGEVVPLKAQALQLMLGMVAKTLFSADVSGRVNDEVQRSWTTIVKGVAWRTMSPVEFLEKVPTPGNRRYVQASRRMRAAVREAVVEQRRTGADDASLLTMLLAARDAETGERMSDEQIIAEIFLILFAGTETAAFMTVWLFHELAREPAVAKQLYAEIDSVLGDGPPTFEAIGRLTYTRRVLTECLRLYHPGWMFMRRTNTTVELGGRELPPGTETLFSIYAQHRDPRSFPEPLRFDPDRWLPGAPQPPDDAYIPFLAGKRQCIGDGYAWAQMVTTIATIVSRWRLEPVPGHPVKELPQALMAPSELPVVVRPRP
ncbi:MULTISPECIES: cytochrome P450 [Micromonospora]|uniref:cytochrome P450 n=1 Tax=Micromonospora TaxID=1873 RepID=UPI0013040BE7|nr:MULTISPECIES: cytochrome P450 [unclassified Micromonospora]MDI5939653.1 cytochrome P450 [Micromonospora sp. DH15]